MNTQNINEKFQSLPHYLKREVLDYIEFLTKRYKVHHKEKRFSFKWEGGLKELKEQFSAVNLQHKAKDYR
jgi:hypothetical protein